MTPPLRTPSRPGGIPRPIRAVLALHLILGGLCASPVNADLVISEFMAANLRTLDDEDGESSDWIEVFNAGSENVDLAGWHLTDDAGNLTQWTFPSKVLGPGEFIVVFASGEDRRDPDRELHTNFRLGSGGEYLGLVEPDGATVADSYVYPPQFTDISYGRGQNAIVAEPLVEGAACRVRVPSSGADDAEWMNPGFDDSAWTAAATGIGYENGSGYEVFFGAGGDVRNVMLGINPSIYIRIPFEIDVPGTVRSLTLRMRYDDGFVAYLNGHEIASANSPATVEWNSAATTSNPDGSAVVYEAFDISDSTEFLTDGVNLLAIHGLNQNSGSSDMLIQPEIDATILGSETTTRLVYFTVPTPGDTNVGGSDTIGPKISDVTDRVPRPSTGSVIVNPNEMANSVTEFSGIQGQGGWEYGYYDRTADLGGGGDGVYQAADFIRFTGGDGQGVWNGTTQQWSGIQWDLETAAAAPWTQVGSTSMHPNDASPGPEQYAIRRWVSDVAGAHTLVGEFSNGSANGDGTTGRIFHNGVEVFSVLTDGGPEPFSEALDLQVGDVLDFMVDTGPNPSASGADGSDGTDMSVRIIEGGDPGGGNDTITIPIQASVAPTQDSVATVTLHFRIMYGAEESVPMRDDGTGGDATAGDGVYTGIISTNALKDGEMLRWRVSAVDGGGNTTTAPPFPDPVDSPQYFGTVATNPDESTSRLPILHWFVQNPNAANSRTGTRGSMFFLDRFYDNILTDLHGQSTSGFPKRSYDVDFNTGERFLWRDGEKKVKDINLLTNWADKSKVRHSLAYEQFAVAGAPHHFAFPVRVQQNGTFFSTADIVEDGDDRYLERVGLDPDGALYKMYNSLDGWNPPGAIKKTRKDEDSSDLRAFVQGLGQSGAQREVFGFDNVNIPECVNYFAAMVVSSNRDHGHKNYYLYRDTNGTGEWSVLTWDMDLSFGHNWTSGSSYFDDTIYGNTNLNDLTAPGINNRLKQFIFQTSDVWQMYVRRLRTVLDRQYKAPGTPASELVLEKRAVEIADLIDPPDVGISDADLDYQKWGSWGNRDTIRVALDRILNDHLPKRRVYLYQTLANQIPGPQPAAPPIDIAEIDFKPVSGNQLEEYVLLRNGNGYAVDISNWTLAGGIDIEFNEGTVIPANGEVFVARAPGSFRARTVGPTGGQRRFVVGPYDGQLSARGETITLATDAGTVIDTLTFAGDPSPAQLYLRVSEVNYHPVDPTAAESAAVPGVGDEDFEFIELHNISATETLDLAGARFVEGVTFEFPVDAELAPGARVLVVSNLAAFEARYGTGHPVAGVFIGRLDNDGETIRLQDAVGENVLTFRYNDSWYLPTDGGGRSLEIRDDGADYTTWDLPESWGISGVVGGTPGAPSGPLAMDFAAWVAGNFSPEEIADPAITGPDSDADGDRYTLLAEYALGLDPRVPERFDVIAPEIVTVGQESYLAVRLPRRKGVIDVNLGLEGSGDMQGWMLESASIEEVVDGGGEVEWLLMRTGTPMQGRARYFVRVRIEG